MGHFAPGGGHVTASPTPVLLMTEGARQGLEGAAHSTLPGGACNYLAIREMWPTWQMGRSNTSAWPEVADEVGCHPAEQGWK